MSWLNSSLSGLKGQFKSLANEVFSEGIVEDTDPFTELSGANQKIKELQSLCASQDAEIKTLRRQNATLHQDKLNAVAKDNAPSKSSKDRPPENEEESSWFWDPPDADASTPTNRGGDEKRRLSAQVAALQAEISDLRSKLEANSDSVNDGIIAELEALKSENANLATNLEDLDNQHQLAIDEVIKLKKELQVSYEILQKKHESLERENAEYKTRLKEKEAAIKDVGDTNTKLVSDLDTIHRKFDNLEKVHRLLTENTEKFQEDNLELNEENFRLQEECARLQHDLEELQNKHRPPVASNENHVPNEKYRELEDKFLDLERKFAETVPKKSVEGVMGAIHESNAQEVIAKLKFEIVELQNKLNTNEEIKRLNLEIDHLKKEVDSLSLHEIEHISCESIRKLIDKYMAPDFPAIAKYLKNSSSDLLEYTDLCLKNYADLRNKKEMLDLRVSEDSRLINKLQSNVDEMSAEIDMLNGDLAHYSHECSELKKNNDFLIAEIGALKSVSKLEPILEHNEEHLEKLQCELEDCSNLNRNFEAKLEKSEIELQEIEADRKKVEEELNFVKEELKHAKDEIDFLKKAHNDSVDDTLLVLTQQKLSDTQTELEKLKTQLHSATVQNEKSKIDHTILDNDKVLLMREISELKANVQTKSIIEDYAKKIEAEKTDLENKLCHLSEMETMVENLNKENDSLKARVADLDALSDSHAKAVNEELLQYRNSSLEFSRLLGQKENELIEAKSKILALESSTKDVFSQNLLKELKEYTRKLTEFDSSESNIETTETNLEEIHAESIRNEWENAVRLVIGKVEKLKECFIDKDRKYDSLMAELSKCSDEISGYKVTCDELRNELNQKDLNISQAEESIRQKEKEIAERNLEIAHLNHNFNTLEQEILDVKEDLNNRSAEVTKIMDLLSEKESVQQTKDTEITLLNEEIHKIKEEISVIKEQRDKLLIEREERAKNELSEVSELKDKLSEKENELEMKNDQISILNEAIIRVQKNLEEVKSQKEKLDLETSKKVEDLTTNADYISLKANHDDIKKQKLEADEQIQSLLGEKIEFETKLKKLVSKVENESEKIRQLELYKANTDAKLEQLTTEKNELINLVTQKHHESITYHAEIQRLNGVLFTESEKYKELERLITDLKETALDQVHSQETEHLKKTLREKADRCSQLESILDEIRKAGITPEELDKLREKNQFLVEKCDVLGKNLVLEQANARQIGQEKAQILEREQSMSRELERLRQHLLEMEEEHTKELVAAEQRWQEAQTKLTSAEEKVKHSSTMYTSNSIRANQEVETLRMQIKLVERQRDEIQAHLSQSEDRNSKNLAALTNLQCVLEQFQMDKEREGEAVAGRARRDLQSAREEVLRLQRQAADLEDKLRDSNSGLRAASRLSAQLDARAAQLQEARDQAAKLEEELNQWKKKYRDAVSNQQDKVDKSLVKNLLMGYIHTANNQRQGDRLQVLRLLSTVLDFDQLECERAGLGRASAAPSASHGADSLAQEFIKFLEKESRPQLKIGLPNLLHLGQAQGPNSPNLSAKSDSPNSVVSQSRSTNSPLQIASSAHSSNSSRPVPIVPLTIDNPILANANSSPVTVVSTSTVVNESSLNHSGNAVFNNNFGGFSLFTPIANPDMVVNQTRNSEGAILKNVLKDA